MAPIISARPPADFLLSSSLRTYPIGRRNARAFLSPNRDRDRISPDSVSIISSRQVMRVKKKYQLGDYCLIQFQILQTNII